MELETVKIKAETGFAIINKDDYDPSVHQLFEEVKPASKAGKKGASVVEGDETPSE